MNKFNFIFTLFLLFSPLTSIASDILDNESPLPSLHLKEVNSNFKLANPNLMIIKGQERNNSIRGDYLYFVDISTLEFFKIPFQKTWYIG